MAAHEESEDETMRFYELTSRFAQLPAVKNLLEQPSTLSKDEDTQLAIKTTISPLERYMHVSESSRKQLFFKEVCPGMIVICRVTHVLGNLLSGYLLQVVSEQRRWIDDMKIKFTCKITDENRYRLHRGLDTDIDVGDKIKGIISSINRDSNEIKLAFNDKDGEKQKLGKMDEDDEFTQVIDYLEESKSNEKALFTRDLKMSPSYLNPSSINLLTQKLGIKNAYLSFLNGDK
jgi:hypothetical protein